MTTNGKFPTWPPKFWVSGQGISATAETNKGKLVVIIAPNAQPGPRLVRCYTQEGASEPRFFVVGSGSERNEKEPNNHFAKAEKIDALPITINGRLDKNGDVDCFAVTLKAGQWLEARVDSYTLMSKVDAVLRLIATNGQQLMWNHDSITLDPQLVWAATNDQTVVLQLFGFAYPPGSDVGLTGGESVIYRLHLEVTNASPHLCSPSTEQEPNDSATNAPLLELPNSVYGRIDAPNDEDRFRLALATNEVIEVRVEAASFGSPLDAWLKMEDLSSHQLARNDDADGAPDPRLEWKAHLMACMSPHRFSDASGRRQFLLSVLGSSTATGLHCHVGRNCPRVERWRHK